MNFVHPSCAAIVIMKQQRSSIMEKKSIVFSVAVTASVELLLIMISTSARNIFVLLVKMI